LIRIIAKRYARALADLSEAKKAVDKAKADLAAFVGAVESDKALQKLFSSPVFTPEHKKAVVKEVAARLGLQQDSARFLEHLAETGRVRFVREIGEAFEELMAERQNRAMARLTTAAPLNNGDLEALKKQLESVTGKNVEIDARVDASLIGGVRAQIGSVIYDGTIKNQLDKMRDRLAK
jgi:F-type H+-transporting ATPase subunit delta